jgi:hypothetical protein
MHKYICAVSFSLKKKIVQTIILRAHAKQQHFYIKV